MEKYDLKTKAGKAAYMKKWAITHKEHLKTYREKNKEHLDIVRSEWKIKNREYIKIWHKAHKKRVRQICLEYYGGKPPKCACCGETIIEFLSLDHINGGGSKHRKERNGTHLSPSIIKDGFPPIYQVLCHNCNQAKGYYGICPHQKLKD